MFEFKKIEDKVLAFWDEHQIFEKSLAIRKKARRFVFFEGPPTANGRPGIHHFSGRAFKDLFNRYKTMRGFYVLRKAGWDTHGLPVELEVEKELGFKNKRDIEEYGIAKFNRKAKESVWKYREEWERMTRRMGFWVDLKHPYVTYENSYIESVWAVIKKIWDKKLIYLAHKVVPYCTRCGTALASHEVAQGYKLVRERSVFLKFKVKKDAARPYTQKAKTYILAWTTTPWTLPGNVALAVGRDIVYVVAKVGNERFIVAKDLAEKVIQTPFTVEAELTGGQLAGTAYEPLFSIPKLKSAGSYKVYEANFVSTADGTGVVHTAVMYGEDDYNLGVQLGLPRVHTVDELGKFTGVNPELDGAYVKAAKTEEQLLQHLRDHDSLFRIQDYEHEYPFCWRCGTALLYYARNSWFIKMSAVREAMAVNNGKVNWVPAHLKEGRFGQWLKEGKDWAISRERYWGTPLPIFKCVKCGDLQALGSFAEFKSANGSGNTYYVLRHGVSQRQEKTKLLIGSRLESDKYHLTEEGEEQVKKSLERLKVLDEKIDLIYTSPFLRAKESANIAAKLLHAGVTEEPRLAEIAESLACEGKPYAECSFRGVRKRFDDKPGDGESWNDARRRLYELMRELESKHRGKRILLAGHGDPLWLLEKIAQGATEADVLAQQDTKADWYPKFGELKRLDWQTLPRNELGELDVHRPFVDELVLKCKKCKADSKRIPDLLDVWFDSGAMPYAQWHWPFENENMVKEQFPADFIVEGVDQTRGWFYTLLAVSTLLGKGPAYRNVMSLGHVLDEKGQKMSKSKGNIVLPGEVMDKYGVDATRWYFYTLNSPGDPKLFSEKELNERLTGFLSTLQNCINFYELYASDQEPAEPKAANLLDKWVISRINGMTDRATRSMDEYDPVTAARTIEKFVVQDLSQWWLRRSRKRRDALPLLRAVLLDLAKVMAPFIPFTAEDMHRRLHSGRMSNDEVKMSNRAGAESVHLHDWPTVNKKLINLKLEAEMERAKEAITAGLALRKDKQFKVRQPLASVVLAGKKFAPDLELLIKDELNVKEVHYRKAGELELDLILTPELRNEGYAREVMRQIQDMRKEAGCRFDEKVYCQWHSDDTELSAAMKFWTGHVKRDTVLSDFMNQPHDDKAYDVQKEFDLEPNKKIWLGIRK